MTPASDNLRQHDKNQLPRIGVLITPALRTDTLLLTAWDHILTKAMYHSLLGPPLGSNALPYRVTWHFL